ncbi:NifB/NifX family molybdenum-iron cluster-binding protein [Amphritea sp.]|uniref:NifB/NifX family molybdenum-iron cluster-binding protein n=1 Tax=Amphritea sp. TaxID=1872502 RepID=UPI003D0B7B93
MVKSTPVLMAVASKDAVSINLHFGHTKAFLIYRVSADYCEFVERRAVDHYCQGHTGDRSALEMILQTINDCHAVFVVKIGDGPQEKLQQIGVTAVSDYGHEAIEASLLHYVQKSDWS